MRPAARSVRSRVGLALAFLAVSASVRADEVNVFAAASLTDALKEVAQGFERSTGHKVVFNLGGSNDLARQIKAGAPADVFFSADKAQMDGLEQAGLVRAKDRVDVLSNVLVAVVPASSTARLAGSGRPALRQATGPGRPAGGSGRGLRRGTWLESVGLWDALKDRIVPTLNVRAALAAVESEHADAGIVYRTDAAHLEAREGRLRGAEGAGAGDRLSAGAPRGVEATRDRRPGALPPLAIAPARSIARHGFVVLAAR